MPLVKLSDLVTKPDHTYAVGAFNVSDMEMAMGAISRRGDERTTHPAGGRGAAALFPA